MIRIVAIGKKHEDWVKDGIERYQKRLRAPFDVKWDLLPHSTLEGPQARQKESEAILSRLNDGEFVVLLDETGKSYDSPTLSSQLESVFARGASLTLVIGGAYGVNDALQQRAQIIWSLSPLVFPHQLVRLILIEQLYRAQEIARGGSYHHR
ncbi:MAG: 23S rRNA (pseudouridine(1915)-N(3))-methyltransferase RlmH [Candidatus Saccharimonas sp.]